MDDQSEVLARKLEGLTEASIDKLREVLALPVDADNGATLRAFVGAAGVALNAQLRADSMRLRALREDRALAALLALIAQQEGKVPPCPQPAGVGRVVSSDTVSADVIPFLA
jgi:hypothetical protein